MALDFASNILWLVLLTLLPGLELRLSIPIGLLSNTIQLPFEQSITGFGLPLEVVLPVVIATNIVLGPVIYFALDKSLHFFIQFGWINNLYKRIVLRTQKKAFPLVGKYGLIGIALFISVPLPGSGSWTGALAAFLLGLGYKRFAIANAAGVLIAGSLVTLATLGFMALPA